MDNSLLGSAPALRVERRWSTRRVTRVHTGQAVHLPLCAPYPFQSETPALSPLLYPRSTLSTQPDTRPCPCHTLAAPTPPSPRPHQRNAPQAPSRVLHARIRHRAARPRAINKHHHHAVPINAQRELNIALCNPARRRCQVPAHPRGCGPRPTSHRLPASARLMSSPRHCP
jgi:hypothetical protein